jgi:ankyrin repeat protein
MGRHAISTARFTFLATMLLQFAACSMTTSPLHSYIKSDQDQEALQMIGSGAAVNERDQMGYTPLHLAAIRGNQTIVEALLDQGADINARDFYGRTPFMLALREGHVEMARFFLESGVSLETNYTLTNPLFDAVTGGSEVMAEYLIERGIVADTNNRFGTTALHIAATKGDAEMISLLLRHGADVDTRDQNGWSALHFAGARKHSGVIRTLLKAGAHPYSLQSDALGAYASGVVFEESAVLGRDAGLTTKAKADYGIAADHFDKAAQLYDGLAAGYQKRIEEQHAKNALAFAFGAFAMAVQPGSPMPTASGGTVRLYTPVIVPQGSVNSMEMAQAAYRASSMDATERATQCRDAAAQIGSAMEQGS